VTETASRNRIRWWAMRPAQNLKPATYRCPLCGNRLPALSEHFLIVPEGDASRRRHAHTECVLAARKAGRLPTEEEWRRTQPHPPSPWRRLRDRLKIRRSWHEENGEEEIR
jgi:hypothetical protein